MRRAAAFFLTLAVLACLTGCAPTGAKEKTVFAMDTVMHFSASGKGAEKALSEAEQRIFALESLLSRTREGSDVDRINRAGAVGVQDVAPETAALLQAAETYRAMTNGAFDVTVAPVVEAWGFTAERNRLPAPEELAALLPLVDGSRILVEGDDVTLGEGQSVDLGGIAKGYASDEVEAILREHEIPSGMVSLGGNVYVHGVKSDGSLWRVGIQDPADPEGYVGVLALRDAYAITSGGYQRYFEENGVRYHHIIDPHTGYPAASGLASVTVVASANGAGADLPGSGTMCDALSTAFFVLGEAQTLDIWRRCADAFDLVLVTEDGRVVVTDGVADAFTPEGNGGYVYETVS